MDSQRRTLLKASGSLGLMGLLASLGLFASEQAKAEWNKAAFEAKNLDSALAALGVTNRPADSRDIQFNAPEVAENGALVPMAVMSHIPQTRSIAILIEKNPTTLAAKFTFPEGTEPSINTRLKMDQTSRVHALVGTDGGFFVASRDITVIVGGCGA